MLEMRHMLDGTTVGEELSCSDIAADPHLMHVSHGAALASSLLRPQPELSVSLLLSVMLWSHALLC